MKLPKLTVTKFKDTKRTPRLRIHCSCGCREHLDIYADENDGAEIGGVYASNKFWRQLFKKALSQTNAHLLPNAKLCSGANNP